MQPVHKKGGGEIVQNKFYVMPPEAAQLSIYVIFRRL